MSSSITDLLNDRRESRSVAIEGPGMRPLTYRRLFDHVDDIAGRLHVMGYGRGDRIAVALPNGPGMAVAFLSIAAGFTCAPLNPAYREKELEFYLSDMKADAVLVPAGEGATMAAVARSMGVPVITLSPAGDEAGVFAVAGERGKGGMDAARAGPGDVALLLHTSGTTSRPKLVPLLQSSVVASARQIAESLALAPRDKCLNVMPLFHVHGLVGAVMASLVSGGSVVCTPGFNGPDFSRWLRDHRPTWYTAVPTIHQKVLEQARAPAGTPASHGLRFIRSSSAALPAAVREGLEQAFGVPVIEAYGMTEAAHQIAANPLPPRARKPGSVGPGTGLAIAIMSEQGSILPPESTGEIVLKGSRLIRGYENNPDANARSFTDGWFRTGDMGHLDADGYLYVEARLKEVINRGGEKVSPGEVEDALLAHPAVREAAAFAIPDPALGEIVGAAVVLRGAGQVTAGSLKKFAAESLAYFKVPAKIWLVEAIPTGPTGKLQRIGLFSQLKSSPATGDAPESPGYEPPATPTEKAIAAIWAEVLHKDGIGRLDGFLDLGGDSLLATMVLSRIGDTFGVRMTIARAMDCDSIALLAEMVDAMAAGDRSARRDDGRSD
jgi:acyl-CoA synthetase (AMP-forming)/AMP-acid ligase II/acyl carrier protein